MSRPVLPWRSALDILPPPNGLVWIRRLPWYDKPVRAQFLAGGSFHLDTPLSTQPRSYLSHSIALVEVHTWKFQFLDDEETAFPPGGSPEPPSLTTEAGTVLTTESQTPLTPD